MTAFSKPLFIRDLPELELLAAKLSDRVEQDGAPTAAIAIRRAYLDALSELKLLADKLAAEATVILKEEETRTRVRPDTQGYGGSRLNDSLEAEVLPGLPGSIGLANEDKLYQEVPWWWTNEEGYSGHVGRVVHGHFYFSGYVGMSDPGAAPSGTHPLFVAEGGPQMTIQEPIPARKFVLKAIERVEPLWHEGVRTIRLKLERQWQASINVAREEVARRLAAEASGRPLPP